jgi:hypothetical protein
MPPDITVSLAFLPTSAGGREHPASGGYLACIMEFEGSYYDCRLLLDGAGPIAPGERARLPIKLLRPELIKPRLRVGDRFRLREQRVIAEGVVETLCDDT